MREGIFLPKTIFTGEQKYFLGSLTMEEIVKQLIPDAKITLNNFLINFIGHKKFKT